MDLFERIMERIEEDTKLYYEYRSLATDIQYGEKIKGLISLLRIKDVPEEEKENFLKKLEHWYKAGFINEFDGVNFVTTTKAVIK